MGAILKIFLEAFIGSFAQAFMDWRRDTDRIATHEALGRKTVEDSQKSEIINAVRTRQQITDDIARMSPADRRRRLRGWGAPAAAAGG